MVFRLLGLYFGVDWCLSFCVVARKSGATKYSFMRWFCVGVDVVFFVCIFMDFGVNFCLIFMWVVEWVDVEVLSRCLVFDGDASFVIVMFNAFSVFIIWDVLYFFDNVWLIIVGFVRLGVIVSIEVKFWCCVWLSGLEFGVGGCACKMVIARFVAYDVNLCGWCMMILEIVCIVFLVVFVILILVCWVDVLFECVCFKVLMYFRKVCGFGSDAIRVLVKFVGLWEWSVVLLLLFILYGMSLLLE